MRETVAIVLIACAVRLAPAATNQVSGTSTLPPEKQAIVDVMRDAQAAKAAAIAALPGVQALDARLQQLRDEMRALQEQRRAIVAQNRAVLDRIDQAAGEAVRKLTGPAAAETKPATTEAAP
jgi:hypothetical protein